MAIDAGSTDAPAEAESWFRCPLCGTRAPTTVVEYDGLGYPVCPACEVATGPP